MMSAGKRFHKVGAAALKSWFVARVAVAAKPTAMSKVPLVLLA